MKRLQDALDDFTPSQEELIATQRQLSASTRPRHYSHAQ
jgi:hypothetical protein